MNAIEALGAPRRREILRLVWQRERSAGDVHRALGDVTFGAVSQQLRILADSGLKFEVGATMKEAADLAVAAAKS